MLKLIPALIIAAATACDGARSGSFRNPADADRLPPLPRASLTDAQKEASDRFALVRGQQPFGPFVPLLRTPELMLAAQSMGDYIRFRSSLPPRIRELAILLTCRANAQEYEWAVHYPLALQAGVQSDVLDSIASGWRPHGIGEDEEAAYQLVFEILYQKRVSEPAWQRALKTFGETGVVELLGTAGYYSFLAVVLNAARTPPPPGPRALHLVPEVRRLR
jgi:4-carboxymuconolactone decarboxylase